MKEIQGTIASPNGFFADGIHCGLKHKKKDIGWIYSEYPAAAAGVFTTNQVKAAPVVFNKMQLKDGTLQAIIVNSGNANACTGDAGMRDAEAMAAATAAALNIDPQQVAVGSTGIIGERLPLATVLAGIQGLHKAGEPQGFHEAILTTDTGTKEVTVTEVIDGKTVTMSGVAKGSGMIHPNMATMLGFITTDAAIDASHLQLLLKELTETTFNQITIDGDTSTNDMVLVLANGAAGNAAALPGTTDYEAMKSMLAYVMETLAKKIAADGEGATKLIEVEVAGADDHLSARMMAKSIVGSSLVKTAIFGKDPNWGRIICSLGYAGIAFNPSAVSIALAGIPVFHQGEPVIFNAAAMEQALESSEIVIQVDLAEGAESGKAWGCDLSYDYIKINALYHT